MTCSLISTNPQEIERLPADRFVAGWCCEARNCPECLRAYRNGLEFMRQERAAKRKPRRPSLKRQITAAEKATGKPVTSITLADGTKLELGTPGMSNANPWDEVLINAADQKRPS